MRTQILSTVDIYDILNKIYTMFHLLWILQYSHVHLLHWGIYHWLVDVDQRLSSE